MKETIEDTLNGVLDGMSDDDIIVAWNEYCNRANYMDDYIYHNGAMFFFENYNIEDAKSVETMITDICAGGYSPNDNYVKFSTQTGTPVSFDYLSQDVSPYDQSSLVDWLIRTYGDDLESIGEFLGEAIEVDDGIYTVGNTTYQYVTDDSLACYCDKCCFHRDGNMCGASDLFDIGALPQCDEDGIGYRGYWIEVEE